MLRFGPGGSQLAEQGGAVFVSGEERLQGQVGRADVQGGAERGDHGVQADHADAGLEFETGHDTVSGPPGRLAGRGSEVPFGLEHEVEEGDVGVLVGLPAQSRDQLLAADRGCGGDPRGTLESSLAAVALGGEIAVVGFVGGRPSATLDPYTIFTTGATLRPIAVGSRAQLAALVHAVSAHRIRPVLDRIFPFDDAPEAFRHYLGGTPLGKVVITFASNHERT